MSTSVSVWSVCAWDNPEMKLVGRPRRRRGHGFYSEKKERGREASVPGYREPATTPKVGPEGEMAQARPPETRKDLVLFLNATGRHRRSQVECDLSIWAFSKS